MERISPPEPEPSANTRSAPSSTVTFSCSAGASVRASSASTGQVYTLTHHDNLSGSAIIEVQAEDVSGDASVGIVFGFNTCGNVSGSVTSNKVINGNAVTFQISLTDGSNPEWTVSIL